MEMVGKKRKVRADKKKDCKPSIPVHLKETIYRLSYITNTPVKDVGVELCKRGILSRKVMEHLIGHLKRSIRFKNSLLMGDLDNPDHPFTVRGKEKKERITLKFEQGEDNTFENISTLAYGLAVTPSMATAILLEASMTEADLVNAFVEDYIGTQLNQGRVKELKKILHYINENNPYGEEFSWAEFFDMIFDEIKIKVGSTNIKRSLNRWIDNNLK
ncbi:hypothetical protein ANABIO32_25320 [Rossellomorea marisflavi]|uniref:hypothetical protein n=1 Tax=Rossellomorea marisflavi TaxID=189381 RepID=UPI0025C9C5D2|nr:hypothetical protein [Rossellomorea marisflavi]GLI84815.1 hypothetical protein ANABIO32_25320 [Rossellomorea marisflavi]